MDKQVQVAASRAPHSSFAFTGNPSSLLGIFDFADRHSETLIKDIHDGTLAAKFDVPDPIRAVICLLVAEFDQHRQVLEWGALPASLKMFIDAFKLSSLPAMRPRSNPYMWAW